MKKLHVLVFLITTSILQAQTGGLVGEDNVNPKDFPIEIHFPCAGHDEYRAFDPSEPGYKDCKPKEAFIPVWRLEDETDPASKMQECISPIYVPRAAITEENINEAMNKGEDLDNKTCADYVGIGLWKPLEKLHVFGTIRAEYNVRAQQNIIAQKDVYANHTNLKGNVNIQNPENGMTFYSGGEKILGTADYGIEFRTQNNTPRMKIWNSGAVTIGSKKPIGTQADFLLGVDGKLVAKEIVVQINSWADNVFEKSYNLNPLIEVEKYIQENKRLPEIPSEQEAKANGVSLNDMTVLLLKKVEELTLYTIAQQKKIEALENNLSNLKK